MLAPSAAERRTADQSCPMAQQDTAETQRLADQVQRLQQKLHDLHNTDVNSLRRAYTSLVQHVQALDVESKHLTNLVELIETTLFTPEYIAHEVGVIAAVGGGLYTMDRLLRMARLPGIASATAAVAGIALIAWRLVNGGTQRMLMDLRNRRTKNQLRHDWKEVRERIEIMLALAQEDLAMFTAKSTQAAQLMPYPATPELVSKPPTNYPEISSATKTAAEQQTADVLDAPTPPQHRVNPEPLQRTPYPAV